MQTTYEIIDYPDGARAVIGISHVANHLESFEGVFAQAHKHAKLRGRYIDVEVAGQQVAIFGPEGRIA